MPSIPCPSIARRLRRTLAPIAVTLTSLALAGCSQGPPRVNQPAIDADDAGELAMEQYDTNGDGLVAGAELEKAPGLRAALPTMDTNGDKAISAEEVAARINIWKQMRTGVMSCPFTVTLDGQPLEGATVTFVPEAFLGDEIKRASGQTGYFGSGGATIAKEDRPDPATSPPGMNLGLYQVKVSKLAGGEETIPRKYNAETVLGQEVAKDVREILNNRVVYALSTK